MTANNSDFTQIPVMGNVVFNHPVGEHWLVFGGGGVGGVVELWNAGFLAHFRGTPPSFYMGFEVWLQIPGHRGGTIVALHLPAVANRSRSSRHDSVGAKLFFLKERKLPVPRWPKWFYS